MCANQSLLNLIQEAAGLLGLLTGWQIEAGSMEAPAPGGRIDGSISIMREGRKYDFAIAARRQLTAPMLPRIIEQLRTCAKSIMMPCLLVAPSIAPSQTEALRQAGVSYVDLKGNLYLNIPGLEVWFVGAARGLKDKPPPSLAIQRETLTKAGGRLIYGLLSDPERVNAPYRELSQRAGVAVGSVKASLDWLQRRGFLRIFGQGRHASRSLVKRQELLERWTEVYGERLRPKLQIGRYRVQDSGLPQITRVDSFHAGQASWGGKMAASLLLGEPHYKPGTRTLYLRRQQDLNLVLAQNKLSRDANGDVEILGAFWPQEDEIKAGVAPPLVVYADLMNAASSRCWEAARAIYERFLKEQIEHDS